MEKSQRRLFIRGIDYWETWEINGDPVIILVKSESVNVLIASLYLN